MDFYTIKRYFTFSADEIKSIIVTVFFLGFMFSFREWGSGASFNFQSGLLNWVNSGLVVLLALLVYISFQRIMAIRKGYKIEYRMWFWGLLAGVILTFVSSGFLPLAFLGTVIIYHLEGHRLGSWRYGLNYKDLGVISMMGPLSLIILALIFKIISFASGSVLVDKMIIVCAILACTNMLPLPWIDGGNVFFASRTLWVFGFAGIVAASVFLYFFSSIIGVILGAVVVAILAAMSWFVFFEEGF